MKIKPLYTIIGALFVLSGCSGNTMEKYKEQKPEIKLEEFFDGPIKGWGIVQDWKGTVTRRFDVEIIAKWDGDTGTLDEKFNYYDGKTDERIWTVTKNANGTYSGTAGDILGAAEGTISGNAINWHYTMDLPVNGKTYRVKFDDWMWQMNDGALINRSYIKKFGITVAELTLFMQKQPPKE